MAKSENVLLAFCDPDQLKEWDANVVKFREATLEQVDKRSAYFRNLINQKEPACHFMPALPGETKPLMVQFTKTDNETAGRIEWKPRGCYGLVSEADTSVAG